MSDLWGRDRGYKWMVSPLLPSTSVLFPFVVLALSMREERGIRNAPSARQDTNLSKIDGKTELVTSSKQPVPLTWHFSMKNSLLPLLDEKGTRMNRKLSACHSIIYSFKLQEIKHTMMIGLEKGISGDEELTQTDSDGGMSEQRSLSKNNIKPFSLPQLKIFTVKVKLNRVWFVIRT